MNLRSINILEWITGFVVTISTLLYSVRIIDKLVLIVICLILIVMLFIKRSGFFLQQYVSYLDLFWVVNIVLILLNKDSEYSNLSLAFLFVGLSAMFSFRLNIDCYKGVLCGILIFTLLNMLVCFINLWNLSLFNTLMQDLSVVKLKSEPAYLLSGLGDGISRNGTLLIIGSSLFISVILAKPKSFKIKAVSFVMFLILFIFLLITGKRAHFLFLILVLLILVFIMQRKIEAKIRRILGVALILLVFTCLILIIVPESNFILERIFKYSDSNLSDNGRFELWNYAIQMFKDNVLFGSGYGSFTNSIFYKGLAGVHNDYLQWLCESGIIGFVVNIIITIGTLKLTISYLIKLNDSQYSFCKILIIWASFIQLFMLLYSFTGIPHFSYDINNIYLLSCGVPYVLINSDKSTKKNIHA